MALQAAHLAPHEVDTIVTVSSTGVAVPTIDARIASRLGLRPDVKRIPLFGLCCVAGAAGMARIHGYLCGFPSDVAVCCRSNCVRSPCSATTPRFPRRSAPACSATAPPPDTGTGPTQSAPVASTRKDGTRSHVQGPAPQWGTPSAVLLLRFRPCVVKAPPDRRGEILRVPLLTLVVVLALDPRRVLRLEDNRHTAR